jgi:hypothetical protein
MLVQQGNVPSLTFLLDKKSYDVDHINPKVQLPLTISQLRFGVMYISDRMAVQCYTMHACVNMQA